jgi:predicted PurR-regulated permease PerM
MIIRLRTAFFITLGILLLWFIYVERAILAPFILAALFAYIFNPVVNFFSHKVRLPRTISIIIIYLLIVSFLVVIGVTVTRRLVEESSQLQQYGMNLLFFTKHGMNNLPDWIRPQLSSELLALGKTKFLSSSSIFSFFPRAVSEILSFIIFIFAAFYLLKDGRLMFDKFLNFIPNQYKVDIEILFRKINAVLSSYLRGQIFLIVLVSVILFIALSILGVKSALILAIFSGFAEIVPIIGPIIAASVAVLVVALGGVSNFGLSSFQAVIIVIITYFILRQIEDYFVSPLVMGRIVKLHPLIIFLSVIAGEHIWGILGVILAVPIAATLRILLEFSSDRISQSERKKS